MATALPDIVDEGHQYVDTLPKTNGKFASPWYFEVLKFSKDIQRSILKTQWLPTKPSQKELDSICWFVQKPQLSKANVYKKIFNHLG